MPTCCDCQKDDLPKSAFSKAQFKKSAKERRCKACAAAITAVPPPVNTPVVVPPSSVAEESSTAVETVAYPANSTPTPGSSEPLPETSAKTVTAPSKEDSTPDAATTIEVDADKRTDKTPTPGSEHPLQMLREPSDRLLHTESNSTGSPLPPNALEAEKQRHTELLKERLQEVDASLVAQVDQQQQTQAELVQQALSESQHKMALEQEEAPTPTTSDEVTHVLELTEDSTPTIDVSLEVDEIPESAQLQNENVSAGSTKTTSIDPGSGNVFNLETGEQKTSPQGREDDESHLPHIVEKVQKAEDANIAVTTNSTYQEVTEKLDDERPNVVGPDGSDGAAKSMSTDSLSSERSRLDVLGETSMLGGSTSTDIDTGDDGLIENQSKPVTGDKTSSRGTKDKYAPVNQTNLLRRLSDTMLSPGTITKIDSILDRKEEHRKAMVQQLEINIVEEEKTQQKESGVDKEATRQMEVEQISAQEIDTSLKRNTSENSDMSALAEETVNKEDAAQSSAATSQDDTGEPVKKNKPGDIFTRVSQALFSPETFRKSLDLEKEAQKRLLKEKLKKFDADLGDAMDSPPPPNALEAEKQRHTELLKERLQEVDASLVAQVDQQQQTQAELVQQALSESQHKMALEQEEAPTPTPTTSDEVTHDLELAEDSDSTIDADVPIKEETAEGVSAETPTLLSDTPQSSEANPADEPTAPSSKPDDAPHSTHNPLTKLRNLSERILSPHDHSTPIETERKLQSQLLREKLKELHLEDLGDALEVQHETQERLVQEAMEASASRLDHDATVHQSLENNNQEGTTQKPGGKNVFGAVGEWLTGSSHHQHTVPADDGTRGEATKTKESDTGGGLLSAVGGWLSGSGHHRRSEEEEQTIDTPCDDATAALDAVSDSALNANADSTGTSQRRSSAALRQKLGELEGSTPSGTTTTRPESQGGGSLKEKASTKTKRSRAVRDAQRYRVLAKMQRLDSLMEEASRKTSSRST